MDFDPKRGHESKHEFGIQLLQRSLGALASMHKYGPVATNLVPTHTLSED